MPQGTDKAYKAFALSHPDPDIPVKADESLATKEPQLPPPKVVAATVTPPFSDDDDSDGSAMDGDSNDVILGEEQEGRRMKTQVAITKPKSQAVHKTCGRNGVSGPVKGVISKGPGVNASSDQSIRREECLG